MIQHFEAVYEQGVLRLAEPLNVPESTRVSGVVVNVEPPKATNGSENDTLSLEEFARNLDEFAVPLGGRLPASFSREDIYADHD